MVASFYLWVFRGTPLLVQLVFFYFGLGAVHLYDWTAIDVAGITIPGAIQAGIFALGLNEGAYMAEIVRAGILSIDPGQMEAAKSLGMTYGQAMRRIVLPQAARVIVPPLGNEFNNMLKTTSLLFVLGVHELYNDLRHQAGQQLPALRDVPGLRRLVPAADHDLGLRPGLDRAAPRARAPPAANAGPGPGASGCFGLASSGPASTSRRGGR